HLKDVLGEIDADGANLHVDDSPQVIRFATITLRHSDAGSGRRPPHQNPPAAREAAAHLTRHVGPSYPATRNRR
ncbi:MAG: hypothetical protein KGP27_17850, partial [Hyphomicrobiales bacterium]|nr:hypothetical protein [Hyphomicrobiales bacterium]